MPRPFEKYQRQLWLVVGALARRGFSVHPDEAWDLIQDFYVDEWERLNLNYDPQLGPFDRYLFGAFFRFARRRIARDYAQKKRMIELSSDLNIRDAAPPADETLDSSALTGRMRKALEKLSALERQTLDNYLRGVFVNERDAAERLGMTRYRLRETLTDALGRLATELDSLEIQDALEQNVTTALWRDGQSASETAERFGIPVSEVHVIRKRAVRHLLTSLHAPTRESSRRDNMSVREQSNNGITPLGLLRLVLIRRDPELFQQLRKRAAEVVDALNTHDEEFTFAERESIAAADPEWLAQVYSVLGTADDLGTAADETEIEIEAAIDKIHADQDREIAEAFQTLVKYLSPKMRDWRYAFGRLAEVREPIRSTLYQRWSKLGAGEHLEHLVRYGITPATFFETTVGLQLLAEQCIEDSQAGTDSVLLLEFGPRVVKGPMDRKGIHVGREQLLAQVRSSPDCPPGAEEPVLVWTCLACAERGRMLKGFKVLGVEGSVLAIAVDSSNVSTDIVNRWSYDTSLRSLAANG